MSWLAVFTVALSWLLQHGDTRFLLMVPATAWAVLALLAWHCLGGRAALLVLVAGRTLCGAGWLLDAQLPEALGRRDLLVEGVICDFPRVDEHGVRLLMDLAPDRGQPGLPGRIHLNWYAPAPEMQPGERWQLVVRLKPPQGLVNPAGFDFEQWLFRSGIGATGYVRHSVQNRRLPSRWSDCPVDRFRGSLASRLSAVLGERPGRPYVLGMTVAHRADLRQADWDLMRRAGITHLMAISGFHIAMAAIPVMLLMPWLMRLWPSLALRPGITPLLAFAAAALYSALAGFGVSVLRALFMAGILTLLACGRRRLDGFQVLALAALGIVWLDPRAVLAPGFWLSFAGVAWLLMVAHSVQARMDDQRGRLRRVGLATLALLRLQLLLGIGLAPLVLAYFDEFSWLGPLGNLLAIPAFSFVIMPLALGGAALLLVHPTLAVLPLHGAATAVEWLMAALGGLVDAFGGSWQPPATGVTVLCLALLAALLLGWWRPLPLRSLAVVFLLPLLAGVQSRDLPAEGHFHVTVLDVGQGLSVVLRTAGHTLVYDAGPAYRQRDAGSDVVVPVLRAMGTDRLDVLMISHDDLDHAGGAAAILSAHPQAVLVGSPVKGHSGMQQACQAGDAWEWDGVRFEVLAPVPRPALPGNDGSCVLRVSSSHGSVLLPGDIERRGELVLGFRDLLAPVDLVLAPHHGSRSSSSPAFVQALQPRYVVFSTGYMNRWNFPAAVVSERWAAVGACLLDTAKEGALEFRTGSGGLRLRRSWRRDHGSLWTRKPASPMPCDAIDAP